MVREINNMGESGRLLAMVREGMAVFDQLGDRIGTIDRVHLGQVDREINSSEMRPPSNEGGRIPADTGLGEVLENVFDPADQIEDAVRGELLKQGFIRVAGADLPSARYIRADQISSVTGEKVSLSLPKSRIASDKGNP